MGVTEQLGIRKRKRLLGVPIGPKETDWQRVAQLGAGAAATVAGARKAKGAVGGLVERGKGAVGQVKDTAENLTGDGDDGVLGAAKDLGDRARRSAEASDEHSTGVGKAFAAVRAAASGGDDDGTTMKQRFLIQEQIDIAVPRRDVYDQWTQFEDMPSLFRAVEQVEQDDDETTSWQAKMLASRREWKAEIKEQIPDQRIVWETSGDVDHRGVVTFHELDDNLTRVQVEMEYHPSGVVEKFGNLFLTVRHRVRKDLRLFKHHLEFENEATGAWRGEIEDGSTKRSSSESSSKGSSSESGSSRISSKSSGNGGQSRKSTRKRTSSGGSGSSRSTKKRTASSKSSS